MSQPLRRIISSYTYSHPSAHSGGSSTVMRLDCGHEEIRKTSQAAARRVRCSSCPSWFFPGKWPLANVWLGVSAEDQKRADERIPLLMMTYAAVRFVSYEPALGPIDFAEAMPSAGGRLKNPDGSIPGLDWVIVGGESGAKARPCGIDWVRDTVRQCQTAGVPVFVKQLGARPYYMPQVDHDGSVFGIPLPLKHGHGGDPSEWPADLRVRQFPPQAVYREHEIA